MTEEANIGQYLSAQGGPFYTLQQQLGLLHEDAFRAGSRALLFVGLAWGIPLVLSIFTGDALGTFAEKPYLLELGAWARFFIAIGLFMLMEKQVEERLRIHLSQFVKAPLLAPGSFSAAAEAVSRSLRRRDSRLAELVCLILAALMTFGTYTRMIDIETSSWGVQLSSAGKSLTLAGWWTVLVSNPLFQFLLLRWFWRLFIWSKLLRELAGLELRLIATHPDKHGGLAFISQFPTAYTTFVFALSCVLGGVLAHQLLDETITLQTYGFVMGGWLILILLLFSYPLLAFRKPLTELKEQSYLACSALATQHFRANERDVLGYNISTDEDIEQDVTDNIPDPSKLFLATQKLSVFLINRSALLPISAAALLPLVAAGATELPFKELLGVMKKLLLF